MSKKRSVVIITIIIVISLLISIYIPNRDKIEENEDNSINYSIVENEGKMGISKNGNIIIEPQYDKVIIPNSHRAVFMCVNGENQKFVNDKNNQIFKEFDSVELIEVQDSKYEKNMLKYENNGMYGRHHTKETIEKHRIAHLKENLSEDTIYKMSIAKKGKKRDRKAVEKQIATITNKVICI